MLKHLRIGVTAVSLAASLLLIALWVRSYYRLDTVKAWPRHTVSSMKGKLFVDGRFVHVESSGAHSVYRFFAGTSIPIGDSGATLRSYASGIPIWFLTLLAATLAAVPWIRWKRRFSLRTLLIATTLVAVGLGIVVAS